jgi:hypothetical protein
MSNKTLDIIMGVIDFVGITLTVIVIFFVLHVLAHKIGIP